MSNAVISLSELIESGVHFGHRASRWNPKMAPFIYGKRNLINIIDLRQTVRGMIRSVHFLEKLAGEGGEVIFVGTKRAAQSIVKSYAQQTDMHWVSERWLGGTLTNFRTVMSRIQRMEELEELIGDTASAEQFSKKMLSALRREYKKIHRNLEGLRNMTRLPNAIVVVDPGHEHICIREARKLDIPVVAIMDTDSDPDDADIVIPCNDDAYRSIDAIMGPMARAIVRGRDRYRETLQKQRALEEQRKKEEAKRQEEIKKARDAAAAQRRRIEEENAARIAEARAKHIAAKKAASGDDEVEGETNGKTKAKAKA